MPLPMTGRGLYRRRDDTKDYEMAIPETSRMKRGFRRSADALEEAATYVESKKNWASFAARTIST